MIQRIEVDSFFEVPLACPFCSQTVIKAVSEDDAEFTPCPHTLFIASDHGFEYRSAAFDQLGIDEMESDFDELDDDLCGIDGITDRVDIPGAVKYVYYEDAPSFLGGYCGFAPPNP